MKTIAKLLLKYFPALCVEIFALMSKQQDDQRIEQWEELEHHRHKLTVCIDRHNEKMKVYGDDTTTWTYEERLL